MGTQGLLLVCGLRGAQRVSDQHESGMAHNGSLIRMMVERRTPGFVSGSKDAQRICCQVRKAHTRFPIKVGLNGTHGVSDHDEARKAHITSLVGMRAEWRTLGLISG
jgi:hypothetical protein